MWGGVIWSDEGVTPSSMRIYTRTGDKGSTALFGGDRVPKSHPRLDAYGTVDETNSQIGFVRALLERPAERSVIDPLLHEIQQDLFVVGADLATPVDARASVPRVNAAYVEKIEAWIDRYESELPPLRSFILPTGSPAGAAMHVARTCCRRAERATVYLHEHEDMNTTVIQYLNRVSDLFFVLARWITQHEGYEETTWMPPSE